MSKKSKSGRSSKKNLPENAAWLEENLEQNMLDLEALSAMPIDDVNAELKALKADPEALIKSINEKLPANAAIPLPKTPQKKSRTRATPQRAADRKSAGSTPSASRRSNRLFGIRSALILSAVIIAASLFVPRLIRDLQNNRLKTATAIEDSTPPADINRPPTYIVGPAVDELVRGVKYTIEGLEQVVFSAPLPTNPGDLTASYRMRVTVDGDGKVTRLTPLSIEPSDFEEVIVDSMLMWQFSTVPGSDASYEAVVTVEYFPE